MNYPDYDLRSICTNKTLFPYGKEISALFGTCYNLNKLSIVKICAHCKVFAQDKVAVIPLLCSNLVGVNTSIRKQQGVATYATECSPDTHP